MRFSYAPLFFLFVLLAGPVSPASGFDRVYWSSRNIFSEMLTDAEKQELNEQHVQKLYWTVDDLVWRAGAWHWENYPARPPMLNQKVIPTVRIVISDTNAAAQAFANPEAAASRLRSVCSGRGSDVGGALAINFACPQAMLSSYAAFLAELHKTVPEITAIVPAGLVFNPGFSSLCASVSEFGAMFFGSAPTPQLTPGMPAPLPVDLARNAETMRAWGSAGVRWRAILPSFAMLNIYYGDGSWRRTSHDWQWNEVILTDSLDPIQALENGHGGLLATRAVQFTNQSILAAEFVSVQFPDRPAIAQSLHDAEAAGALGAVFLLPSSLKDESGWSLRQLGHPDCTKPELTLLCEENRLILSNTSAADLPPAWRLPKVRGYILELLADGNAWEAAQPGDYYNVTGFEDVTAAAAREMQEADESKGNFWRPIVPHAVVVPIRHANRLQFPFTVLHAG